MCRTGLWFAQEAVGYERGHFDGEVSKHNASLRAFLQASSSSLDTAPEHPATAAHATIHTRNNHRVQGYEPHVTQTVMFATAGGKEPC